MNNLAVEALELKRQQLLDEQSKMIEKFKTEISEIETAIEILSGKKVWEAAADFIYQDESQNYVRSSPEEM